jgi:exodeoxyribonuclease VII large subunit
VLLAPGRQLARADQHLAVCAQRLSRRAPQVLASSGGSLDDRARRLALLDPVNLLRRGWSITRTAEGDVVRSVGAVPPGVVVTTQVADGTFTSRIEEP